MACPKLCIWWHSCCCVNIGSIKLDLTVHYPFFRFDPMRLGGLEHSVKPHRGSLSPRSSLGLYRSAINTHTVLTFARRDAQQTHSLVSGGTHCSLYPGPHTDSVCSPKGTLIYNRLFFFNLWRQDSFTGIFSFVGFPLIFLCLNPFLKAST